jgi:hypothetical protein
MLRSTPFALVLLLAGAADAQSCNSYMEINSAVTAVNTACGSMAGGAGGEFRPTLPRALPWRHD